MILVVDPGDTSGLALFEDNGKHIRKWQSDFPTLLKELQTMPLVSEIVVEDYRLRQGKQMAQTGSRFQAVQVIGALKYHAAIKGAELHLANVQAKTLGAMYSGVKQPSNHKLSHEIDAYNIGIYWLVTHDIIDAPACGTLL